MLVNNGYTWEAYLNETFSDALLGGMDVALENLYAAEDADETAETESTAAENIEDEP